MISAQLPFKTVERGFKKTLVLIPGWASDYRIFGSLDLDYNYVLPTQFDPFSFEDSLKNFLKKYAQEKISILGLSLGGFVAAEFAALNPGLVEEIILVSIRHRYNLRALQNIERKLQQNRKAFLYKFYLSCFSAADKEGLRWFKQNLLRKYLEEMTPETLIRGIDYLSSTYLRSESLNVVRRLKLLHGKLDVIAPFKESQTIKSYLPQAEFICVEDSGHFLHLNPNFKTTFNG